MDDAAAGKNGSNHERYTVWLSVQGGNWVAIRLLFRLAKFQNPGKTGMWKGICAGVLAGLQNQ